MTDIPDEWVAREYELRNDILKRDAIIMRLRRERDDAITRAEAVEKQLRAMC